MLQRLLAKAVRRNTNVLKRQRKPNRPNILRFCQVNLVVMKMRNKEESPEEGDKAEEPPKPDNQIRT